MTDIHAPSDTEKLHAIKADVTGRESPILDCVAQVDAHLDQLTRELDSLAELLEPALRPTPSLGEQPHADRLPGDSPLASRLQAFTMRIEVDIERIAQLRHALEL